MPAVGSDALYGDMLRDDGARMMSELIATRYHADYLWRVRQQLRYMRVRRYGVKSREMRYKIEDGVMPYALCSVTARALLLIDDTEFVTRDGDVTRRTSAALWRLREDEARERCEARLYAPAIHVVATCWHRRIHDAVI